MELMVGGLAGEENLLAVRRPARTFVLKVMIGDPGERSARSRNHPDVGIVAVVVLLSRSIGYECDSRAVRAPLRIGIIPVLSIRDLPCFPSRNAHHPQMLALVVIPSGVVELVLDMRIVPHIAGPIRRRNTVGGAGSADDRDSSSIGRPLIGLRAVLYLGKN